jgi:GT2 family glycosyltransferase
MIEGTQLVSVITTTNSSTRLVDVLDLLESLKCQTHPDLEFIFVGELEPDLTIRVREYAIQLGMKNVLSLFNDGQRGLSAARNLGIRHARGEILAFLDDDVLPFDDWAEGLMNVLRDDSVIGVTGAALPLWQEAKVSWFPEELYWIFSCTAWTGWSTPREVRNAWGMNMAFKREAFARCGGFSPNHGYPRGTYEGGLGEDNEFSLRVRSETRKSIIFSPSVRVWHKVRAYRLQPGYIRKRAFGLGRSRRGIFRSHHGRADEVPLLESESLLLKRILAQLVPQELIRLFREPRTSVLRLSVLAWTLFFIALGYLLPHRSEMSRPKE